MTDVLPSPLREAEHATLLERPYNRFFAPAPSSLDAPATRSIPIRRVRLPDLPWTRRLVTRLLGYLELEADWDSYGGRPTALEAIVGAAMVLQHAPQAPDRMLPTSRGGVQFEWEGDDGGIELEVLGPQRVELLVERAGEMVESTVTVDDLDLAKLLAHVAA